MADLSRIAAKLLGTLASVAVQKLLLSWGLESDLKSLETSLSSINAVVLDAQEQHTTNHKLNLWLRQLKHVLYDAEDVLDDFSYEVLRKQIINSRGGVDRKLQYCFFSTADSMVYRNRVSHRIKGIRQRLDEIKVNQNEFNLAANLQADNGHVHQHMEREMSHSFVNASDIIGRDTDRETIVQFLLDSQGHDKNVSVIPIVGIGGIGKTCLAKLAFNDKRVVEHFDRKVWVCLGDIKDFNVNHVMSNIVKSLTGDNSVDTSNPEQLQKVIQEKLRGQIFLLVLDDVWDANRDKWLELNGLFSSGARGSKIVVTTRIDSVASCVSTVAFNLEGLPHEQSVSLFKKLAFASEDVVDVGLMKIGEEIVKKCKGVPLAVRSLGSSLFSKSEEREWLLVKDSDIWQHSQNDILSILKFSYDRMSPELKQCFVYCSLYPEDYVFCETKLIFFWMAHGLLKAPKKKEGGKNVPTLQLKDVGKQYVKELLSRSFFQDFKEHIHGIWTFKMHDLVRALACSLGEEEFAIMNVNGNNICENVRHVWFQVPQFSGNLMSNAGIQTVLVPDEGFGGSITFVERCITKFKHLKVLDVRYSKFKKLPKCIGTLKHLRYLDLSSCRRLKRLPNSICKLHNLQSLLLVGCLSLKRLPKRIGELGHLQWLMITTKQKHLPKKGIECLTCLLYLGFVECPNLEALFEGANLHLTSLRHLFVSQCDSLISLFKPTSTSMTSYELPALESLLIRNCPSLNLNSLAVSPRLQLPMLSSLTFVNSHQLFMNTRTMPQWIEGCSHTLQYLEIKYCESLTALPEWLPDLNSLRTLKIEGCPELKSLPQGMERLTTLKELHITKCDELGERCDKERGGEDWPKISHVLNIILTE